MKKRQMNIKMILLRDHLLSILVPFILLGFILTYYIAQLTLEKSMTEVVISNNKTVDSVNSCFRSAINTINKFKADKVLYDKLSYHYWSFNSTLPFKQYNEFENTINYFSDEITDIQVYTSNETIVNSTYVKQITDDLCTKYWFQEALKRNGNTFFFYEYNNLYLSCLLKKYNPSRNIHVICIKMNMDKINTIFNEEKYSNLFVDDNGCVIASSIKNHANKKLSEVKMEAIYNMGNGIYHYQKKNFNKAVVTAFQPAEGNTNFKIVTFINNRYLTNQTLRAIMISFSFIIVSLIFTFFSLTIFSRNILYRFRLIKQQMHQVAKGDFSYKKTEKENIVEFDNLFNDLDKMSQSLADLINQVYEVTYQKNEIHLKNEEMKFKLLTNQINPHFLINTLETIRMKAFIDGDKELADIVKRLGKIMRYNLEIGVDEVELENEIIQIENYFEIQKFRFQDRLNYNIYKENMIHNYKILPLMIQPIIENSIIHGFQKFHTNMEINLFFEVENEKFNIIVLDNGHGISEERLVEIREVLSSGNEIRKNHIGLFNIHHRAQLHYGKEYGIEIYSVQNSFTKVILSLPVSGSWGALTDELQYKGFAETSVTT